MVPPSSGHKLACRSAAAEELQRAFAVCCSSAAAAEHQNVRLSKDLLEAVGVERSGGQGVWGACAEGTYVRWAGGVGKGAGSKLVEVGLCAQEAAMHYSSTYQVQPPDCCRFVPRTLTIVTGATHFQHHSCCAKSAGSTCQAALSQRVIRS